MKEKENKVRREKWQKKGNKDSECRVDLNAQT